MQASLPLSATPKPVTQSHNCDPALDQYWTPHWAAQELTNEFFGNLKAHDRVIELSCGDGAFLAAVPDYIEAVGVEIDPVAAEMARANTGRRVMVGDCATVTPPGVFSTLLGNPPFDLRLFLRTLDNAKRFTTQDARGGFIVPAYFTQTSSKVLGLSQDWSLRTVNIPRNLFPGLSKPLMFLLIERSNDPVLTGFALYQLTEHMNGVDRAYRELIARSKSGWVQAIHCALHCIAWR